jgi:hypothetical protein
MVSARAQALDLHARFLAQHLRGMLDKELAIGAKACQFGPRLVPKA